MGIVVLDIGTRVNFDIHEDIKDNKTYGKIMSVTISGQPANITYKICYWVNDIYYEVNLPSHLVTVLGPSKSPIRIGFASENPPEVVSTPKGKK